MSIPRPRLYKQIYHLILEQIYNGELKKGDILPPITQLARRYDLSVNTINAAFSLLRQEGYIRSVKKKGTEIIRDTPPAASAMQLFMERGRSCLEVSEMLGMLVPEMAAFGAGRCTQNDFDAARDIIAQVRSSLTEKMFHAKWEAFLTCFLRPLHNSRFMNLFQSANKFICFSMTTVSGYDDFFMRIRRRTPDYMQRLLHAAEKGELARFRSCLETYYKAAYDRFGRILEQQETEQAVEESEFIWIQDKASYLLYSNIAGDLLRKIVMGLIPYGTYLPAQTVLKEEYGASVNSVRSAFAILTELGMVRYVSGKGYLVEAGKTSKLEHHSRISAVDTFIEILQIMILTSSRVSRQAFARLSAKERRYFMQKDHKLYQHPQGQFYFPPRLMMCLVIHAVPGKTTREVYRELERGMAFGGYHHHQEKQNYMEQFEQIHDDCVQAMAYIGTEEDCLFAQKILRIAVETWEIAQHFIRREQIHTNIPVPDARDLEILKIGYQNKWQKKEKARQGLLYDANYEEERPGGAVLPEDMPGI